MISPARTVAFKLLSRIDSGSCFSDDALHSESMETLDVRDRHLVTEIIYGTLRTQALLDYILASISSKPWTMVESNARILLRMSLYQMWRMDRIPDHALVNDAVELAKRKLGKGIDKFVNAILRQLARVHPWGNPEFLKKAPPWIHLSLPQWLWERWAYRFGVTNAYEFAASLNIPTKTAFRLPSEKLSCEIIHSDRVPGACYLPDGSIENIPNLQHQDEASQLIPHLLGHVSGWRIWDTCAAPGGKTAVLSKLCGNSGMVIASDLRKERCNRLIELLKKSGLNKPKVLVLDASKSPPFRCRFDAVIADVPCSGLGTLRRNPEIKWNFRPEDFDLLRKRQMQILYSVSDSVRVGGCLLYSTCSTEPEENEDVVNTFLQSHPGFSCEPPAFPPGIEKWTGPDHMIRTFPSILPWDGFFAALLIRKD
jgi:16S rRNA (cytosine967-C5)-methyltransferase